MKTLSTLILVFASTALMTIHAATGNAQLSCDLDVIEQSGLGSEFYKTPVAFEQRKVTGVYLDLTDVRWAGTPTLAKVTIVYEQRAAKTLTQTKAYEEILVGKSLRALVDVPFFSNYYGSQEVRLTWDPQAKITWDDKGQFTAKVPGWVLFIEAQDPYHNESFERSLNCH